MLDASPGSPTVLACPVCAGNQSGDRTWYLVATAVMLLLPAGLLGGLVAWLRRAAKRAA